MRGIDGRGVSVKRHAIGGCFRRGEQWSIDVSGDPLLIEPGHDLRAVGCGRGRFIHPLAARAVEGERVAVCRRGQRHVDQLRERGDVGVVGKRGRTHAEQETKSERRHECVPSQHVAPPSWIRAPRATGSPDAPIVDEPLTLVPRLVPR